VGSFKALKVHFTGYRRSGIPHQNSHWGHVQSGVQDIHGSSLWSTLQRLHKSSLYPRNVDPNSAFSDGEIPQIFL